MKVCDFDLAIVAVKIAILLNSDSHGVMVCITRDSDSGWDFCRLGLLSNFELKIERYDCIHSVTVQ